MTGIQMIGEGHDNSSGSQTGVVFPIAAVAALGAVYLAEGKTETAAEHKPDYLRKSQAEREREVAERQGEMDKLAAGIVVVEKK